MFPTWVLANRLSLTQTALRGFPEGAAAELLQLPCSKISTWVLATCCLGRACHLSMLTVRFLLWLVCSRVLPENTFMQCFPDSVHICPRTFLDGDSRVVAFASITR